jgi:hypothetical protein
MAYDPVKAKFEASLRWLFGFAEDDGVLDRKEKIENPFIVVQVSLSYISTKDVCVCLSLLRYKILQAG